MKSWNDPSIIREPAATLDALTFADPELTDAMNGAGRFISHYELMQRLGKTARPSREDKARIRNSKTVNKIKGGYSTRRTDDLKATKPQIDYLLGLETRLGYKTVRDDHRDLTRLEASDKIATYQHRLGNK